jgi:DNA-binding beta-propeller fold protein YncE
MTLTTNELRYELVEGWEQLPAGLHHADVAGVAVDSADRIFIITRGESRVIVYNSDGSFAAAWGDGMFTPRTHGITVAPDDTVYCVDDGRHVVFHFTPDGSLLQIIGTPNIPSNTGYRTAGGLSSITHGGPPFNRPTNLAIAPSGELYVSDGYGNARVHRFTADGELIQSWGEPGVGPGQFHLPHGIAVAAEGQVMVADRENDRIQIFTADGEYLNEWTDVQRPTHIAVDATGRVYVSELWRRTEDQSRRLGPTDIDQHGRVSVYDPAGTVLVRLGGPDRCAPGNFIAPHGIAVDSSGGLYVSEVTQSFAVRRGLVPEGSHTLQKFTRVAV